MKNDAVLFVASLFSRSDRYAEGKRKLASAFGPFLSETPPAPWDYSDYYRDELGSPLFRSFIFFRDRVLQEELAAIKIKTSALEAELSLDGKRTVNLDPGYMTPAKVVLASTKDYSHRIYLGQGIYGEITLIYKGGGFQPHVNTYRDYRDYAGIFDEARRSL